MRRPRNQRGHRADRGRCRKARPDGSRSPRDHESEPPVCVLRQIGRGQAEGRAPRRVGPFEGSVGGCRVPCGGVLPRDAGSSGRLRRPGGLSRFHIREDGAEPLRGGIRKAPGPRRDRWVHRSAGGLHPGEDALSVLHDGQRSRSEDRARLNRRGGVHGRLHGGGRGAEVDTRQGGDGGIVPLDGSGVLEVPEDLIREGSRLPRLRFASAIARRGAC